MYKQWYSKDTTRWLWLSARFGRLMASDDPGGMKDRIHVLPMLSFWLNRSGAGVEFGWLTFEFHLNYTDYRRHDEYVLRWTTKGRACRWCKYFRPMQNGEGQCGLAGSSGVYGVSCREGCVCENFEKKRKWYEIWK